MIGKLKSMFLNKKFLSFLIIGVINTVSAQLIYLAFVVFGTNAGLSSIIGDVLSVFISYFLNIKFTYKVKHSLKLLITFPISYVPGWIINYLIVISSVYLGVPDIYAKAISLPITIPLNYVVMSVIMKIKGEKKDD